MAEFYAPQFNPPADVLGSYIRGQMAPLQVQAAQQDVQSGALKLDQLRMAMANQQAYQDVAFQQLRGQGYSVGGQAGGQNPASASGGIQNGPQGSVSAPRQASGSYDGSVGGYEPSTLGALAILRGDDPLKTAQGVQEYQQKQKQIQAQGPLDLLDTVFNSDQPARTVMNNPSLIGKWPQVAARLGLDPVKDFNDDNVRKGLAMAANELRGQAGMPAKEYPVPQQTINGPLGSIYQKDQVTGAIKQVKAEEPLKDVIDPNTGLPTNVRASQAEGKQPFNQSIFGASNLSDQSKEFAYQSFVATGKIPANFGRNPAMQASLMDYISKRASADGNSAASIAAKGQAFQATQGVVSDFTKGKTAQTLNGINTAVQHMSLLDPLIDNLNNTDAPIFNKAANFFKQQTGQAAPTNFAALKEFVSGEVAKAVLPGGGGEAERKALAAPLDAANSPEQLKQAVTQIKSALAGKTEALRNQWDVGTNGMQGSFDKFLLPETKKALGVSDAPKGGDVPLMTPEQARAAPKGTRFKTTDGRVLVKQ